MGRWEPDAAGRLGEAALALFDERGYEQTTVADISERAGVTPRTFFRHYTDKREVLFAGSERLATEMVAAIDEAPAGTAPLRLVSAALQAAATMLGERRAFSQRRQTVVMANPELRERELLKMASLGAAMRDALGRHGVPEPDATLGAEAAIVVFRVAFERWLAAADDADLAEVMRDCTTSLSSVTKPATRRRQAAG